MDSCLGVNWSVGRGCWGRGVEEGLVKIRFLNSIISRSISALRLRLPTRLKFDSILQSNFSRRHREQSTHGSWTTSQRSCENEGVSLVDCSCLERTETSHRRHSDRCRAASHGVARSGLHIPFVVDIHYRHASRVVASYHHDHRYPPPRQYSPVSCRSPPWSRCVCDSACRKQPWRLAHDSRPPSRDL